jgi:hypothetical protein
MRSPPGRRRLVYHTCGILTAMRLPFDPRFQDERARFHLVHCCEDCAYFEPATGGCRHFWPNDHHRAAYYEEPVPEVVFCKEFELE